jgi:hypothetical protein
MDVTGDGAEEAKKRYGVGLKHYGSARRAAGSASSKIRACTDMAGRTMATCTTGLVGNVHLSRPFMGGQ